MNKASPAKQRRGIVGPSLVVIAAILLLISLKLPLWQMRLEAPQYHGKEALHIAVHPNALRGDLGELAVLDRYIGVHIPPTLPQFKWLPGTLIAGAVLGMIAVLVPGLFRRRALLIVVAALIIALATAAVQAGSQMRDIGHNRDRHTALVGVKDFSPPFLGTTKIAQFEVSSRFGWGAWLIGAALTLQLGAAWLSRRLDRNPELKRSADSFIRVPRSISKIRADKAVRTPTS
jgi:hypothetical protein